ncbi:MAG TPA: tetratricopeptide repeat protein [Coleofasciculaceae cyanobacterium]
MPDQSNLRNSQFKLFASLAVAFVGLCTLVTLAVSSWYVLYVLPEETWESLNSTEWEDSNIRLMAFTGPDSFRNAEKELQEKLSKNAQDDDLIPHYLLAELYNMEQQPGKAMSHYQAAIRQGEQSWYHQAMYRLLLDDAHGKLSILYYEQGKGQQALDEMKQIRNIAQLAESDLLLAMSESIEEPDRADFHMSLGKAFQSHGKMDKAREEVLQARDFSKSPQLRMEAVNLLKTRMPRSVANLTPMARYYTLAGDAQQWEYEDLSKAVSFYEKAVREAPDAETGYYELANLYRQMKDYGKAETYASRALALNPESYHTCMALGDIAMDKSNYPKAVAWFQKAQRLMLQYPDEETQGLLTNMENQLGFAHELLNQHDEAMRHYRQALLVAGQSDSYTAEEDYEYAQDAIERLVESEKEYAQTSSSEGKQLSSR